MHYLHQVQERIEIMLRQLLQAEEKMQNAEAQLTAIEQKLAVNAAVMADEASIKFALLTAVEQIQSSASHTTLKLATEYENSERAALAAADELAAENGLLSTNSLQMQTELASNKQENVNLAYELGALESGVGVLDNLVLNAWKAARTLKVDSLACYLQERNRISEAACQNLLQTKQAD